MGETKVARPEIDQAGAVELAYDVFGLKVKEIKELNGYDDKNFYISVQENKDTTSEYVLKVVNGASSENVVDIDAQNQMLLYLARTDIRCPRPLPSKTRTYCPIVTLPTGKHVVRLLEYIPGEILYNVEGTPALFFEIGALAARLDEALKDFYHPVYETYTHPWTMDKVPEISDFLKEVQLTNTKRIMVENIVEQFSIRVMNSSHKFETGLIHGDINEQNIVVEKDNKTGNWKFKAILDFSDATITYYLVELAITMAYMMFQARNIDVGGYVLAGYTSVRTLPEVEFGLLKICIEARLCQSVVKGAYESLKDPQNAYILTTSKVGWQLLTKLWETQEETLLQHWRTIADNYKATL